MKKTNKSTFKKNILIVEDDENYRNVLATVLPEEGIGVFTAANGHEALFVLDKTKVDLILLDIMMPEMSGKAFMYEFSKSAHKKTPIIILTNLPDSFYGADIPIQMDFVTKADISLDALIQLLKKRLELNK